MNFLLTIYIPDLVVLFGSGFGGSQAPPESPRLSLPPSGDWFALPPLSQWGLTLIAIFSVCFIEEPWEGKDSPLIIDAGSLLEDPRGGRRDASDFENLGSLF